MTRKCPQCHDEHSVSCYGRKYALYPAGCFVLLGPGFALAHQVSTPLEYECQNCGVRFKRRTRAAKLMLGVILVFVLYLFWLGFRDVSEVPEEENPTIEQKESDAPERPGQFEGDG